MPDVSTKNKEHYLTQLYRMIVLIINNTSAPDTNAKFMGVIGHELVAFNKSLDSKSYFNIEKDFKANVFRSLRQAYPEIEMCLNVRLAIIDAHPT